MYLYSHGTPLITDGNESNSFSLVRGIRTSNIEIEMLCPTKSDAALLHVLRNSKFNKASLCDTASTLLPLKYSLFEDLSKVKYFTQANFCTRITNLCYFKLPTSYFSPSLLDYFLLRCRPHYLYCVNSTV